MTSQARVLWWVIGLLMGVGVAVAAAGWGTDVLLGVIAPSVVAATSWVVMVRAWTRAPESLLPVMLKAFAMKALVFVGYAAFVLGVLDAPMVPFVGSFAAAFVLTHLTEAYYLQQLLASVLTGGRSVDSKVSDTD